MHAMWGVKRSRVRRNRLGFYFCVSCVHALHRIVNQDSVQLYRVHSRSSAVFRSQYGYVLCLCRICQLDGVALEPNSALNQFDCDMGRIRLLNEAAIQYSTMGDESTCRVNNLTISNVTIDARTVSLVAPGPLKPAHVHVHAYYMGMLCATSRVWYVDKNLASTGFKL